MKNGFYKSWDTSALVRQKANGKKAKLFKK